MQNYPNSEQPFQSYPQPMYPQPSPSPRKRPFYRRRGCVISLIVVVVLFIAFLALGALSGGNSSPNTTKPPTQSSHPTSAPTSHVAQYPPKTQADLRALAALGDASQVHEFHSESVGLTGACPQPKRLVTVAPSITGKQLAEDLLAYFYAQKLDSPCGSIVFAYHTQDEANGDGYTAGRINFDVTDSSGQVNVDPNANGLTYKLTLNTGDVATGQESTVTYTK